MQRFLLIDDNYKLILQQCTELKQILNRYMQG
jgi:hypothetical protein